MHSSDQYNNRSRLIDSTHPLDLEDEQLAQNATQGTLVVPHTEQSEAYTTLAALREWGPSLALLAAGFLSGPIDPLLPLVGGGMRH